MVKILNALPAHSGDSDAATDLYLTFSCACLALPVLCCAVCLLGNEKERHCLPHTTHHTQQHTDIVSLVVVPTLVVVVVVLVMGVLCSRSGSD